MNLRDGMEMIGAGVPGDRMRVATAEQAASHRRKKAVESAALEKKEIKLGLRQKPMTLDIGRRKPGFTVSRRG